MSIGGNANRTGILSPDPPFPSLFLAPSFAPRDVHLRRIWSYACPGGLRARSPKPSRKCLSLGVHTGVSLSALSSHWFCFLQLLNNNLILLNNNP